MSGRRKINDDELTGLIKEGLLFTENEMPVVTQELMDKTLNYIRENEDSTHKEICTEKKRSSYKRWIPGAAACAACLILIAGGMFLNHTEITKPDTKNSTSEIAMENSQESDYFSESEESGSDGLFKFNDTSEFDSYSAGSIEETPKEDSIADCEDELPFNNKDSANESAAGNPQTASDSENADTGSSKKENIQKNYMDEILTKDRISGSEIDFPENILGCSVQDINSVITENANGETKTLGGDDIKQFCRRFENEFSSKKDEYDINGIAYYQLSNDWKRKILIQSEDSYGEYKFYNIFIYENSFAVCPFPETETNPGLICTIYE